MKQFRYLLSILLIVSMSFSFMGCDIINSTELKLGLRNSDFDYIINEKADKIIIQSSRDPGFRFIVTDQSAIEDIYNILKKGKVKSEKTSLEPDYVLEVYIGNEIKKYNYVVNIDERNVGNFYCDDQIYDISNNLDNIITDNLSFIRKPKDFNDIYYQSILNVLDIQKDQLSSADNKVGVDIGNDVDCLKYMFSIELNEFIKQGQKIVPSLQLVSSNYSDYNTIIKVKNRGYSTKKFKTMITVDNKKNKSYMVYYITGEYEYKKWKISVSEPNEMPDNW